MVITMTFSGLGGLLLFDKNVNQADAAVANDFKVFVMAPLEKIYDWNAFARQLSTLKNNGVYALTTDVWWGYVEGAGDNVFDWSYYKQYADVVRKSGLKWVPIMSTHQCGGNVGDNVNIPIPGWLWSKDTADNMKFKSETGSWNSETLAPWWSGLATQYDELYASFASNFSGYKDIITKIYLSGGPAGELRYPSYSAADGWTYPSRGKIECFSGAAIADFRNSMQAKYGTIAALNASWGINLTAFSGIYPPGDADNFFKYGWYTNYGKDFMDWYQGVLIKHIQTISAKAHARFDTVFGVRVGAKISGVHWQMNNPSMPHSAEKCAGYNDYGKILDQFKASNIDLTFTCLEMDDSKSYTYPEYSAPASLVTMVSNAAKARGVRINGENALPIINDNSKYVRVGQTVDQYNYNGFTLLRLGNIVRSDGGETGEMWGFKNYIINKQPPEPSPTVTANLPTSGNTAVVYYKKGTWPTSYLHYSPEGYGWTIAPGLQMSDNSGYDGYSKIVVYLGTGSKMQACFNNGSGTWDNNSNANYTIYSGISTVKDGKVLPGTPDVTTSPTPGNKITIYYKQGFSTPYVHYRSDNGVWTISPGVAMGDSEVAGYKKITIDVGSASRGEVAFNNGAGLWDDNGGQNYVFNIGTFTYTPSADRSPGALIAGAPVVQPSPSIIPGPYGNEVTVYYKKGFTTPYIHYRPAGGTWTTVPGKPMPDAEIAGYAKMTINIGDASQLEACFNNGSGIWDSNSSKNYFFGVGTWTYTPVAPNWTGVGTITQGIASSNPLPASPTPQPSTVPKIAAVYYNTDSGFDKPIVQYRTDLLGDWKQITLGASNLGGWSKVTIDMGSSDKLYVAWTDGKGNWDNNSGGFYEFRAGVFNYSQGAILQGAPSGAVSDNVPPGAPVSLAVYSNTWNTATLTWSEASDNYGVASYDLFKDGQCIASVCNDMMTYKVKGLTGSSTYNFIVKAKDGDGNISIDSNTVSVATYAAPADVLPPTAPTGLVSTAKNDTAVSLSWNASTDNTGVQSYDVYNGGNYIGSSNTTNYTAALLAPYTQQKFTVRALDAEGNESELSNVLYVTTDAPIDTTAPSVVTTLTSTAKTSTTVTLSWSPSTDNVKVTGYDILNGDAFVTNTTGTSYTVAGLAPNTEYTFEVKAKDLAGNASADNNKVTVITNPATGNMVTVYYKRGFATPYMHYKKANGTWTVAPGTAIPQSETAGYNKITIDIGSLAQLECVFTNGSGIWDNNAKQNYKVNPGTWTYVPNTDATKPGTWYQGAPGSTPINILSNGGFENGNSYGWSEWHPTGQIAKFGVDSNDVHSGTYKLYFWDTAPYKQSMHQIKTGLSNGTYKVGAWVKVIAYGSNPTTARMEVLSFGGQDVYVNASVDSTWRYFETTVNVTNGQIDIGFYIDCPGSTSMQIDDVTLIAQ